MINLYVLLNARGLSHLTKSDNNRRIVISDKCVLGIPFFCGSGPNYYKTQVTRMRVQIQKQVRLHTESELS